MSDSRMLLATQLARIILPIIIFVGIVGNSINIAVLTRPSLYNHACSRYFLALATNYLFYSVFVLVNGLLVSGYEVDLSQRSDILCKLITYVISVCIAIGPYLIILALIDRYCASSMNAQRRKFSHVNVTRWALMIVITLFGLYFVNTLVLVDLRSDGFGCTVRGDTIYKQVYSIIQVMLFAVIAPILMAIFGGMTIYNVTKVQIVPAMNRRFRRTENQLVRMLLLQVGTHIVLSLPTCVLYLIAVLPNSLKFTLEFAFAYKICQLPFYSSADSAFILYFLSSGIYRKECIRIIYKILRIHRENQVYPEASLNTAMPMGTLAYSRSAALNITKHDRSTLERSSR